MDYKVGDAVACNGNPNGRIIEIDRGLYTVRLWDNGRLVGDVCVGKATLDRENICHCEQCEQARADM